MKQYLIYKKAGIIYLTGDKEFEGIYNYFILKGRTPSCNEDFRNFAFNYLAKYDADVVLKKNNIGYYYTVKFNNRKL